ncbi:hypothetical protein O988_00016 [Pseudogymnoascus sp. VKM F-3808]|nr:hypothetical protein O988_00016 [Pseudogymnoascus sp. VKM F-3808]
MLTMHTSQTKYVIDTGKNDGAMADSELRSSLPDQCYSRNAICHPFFPSTLYTHSPPIRRHHSLLTNLPSYRILITNQPSHHPSQADIHLTIHLKPIVLSSRRVWVVIRSGGELSQSKIP